MIAEHGRHQFMEKTGLSMNTDNKRIFLRVEFSAEVSGLRTSFFSSILAPVPLPSEFSSCEGSM